MIFGFSGLNRAELRRILQEMKAICGKEEEEALKHLDVLLNSANDLMEEAQQADEKRQQSFWERDNARQAIDLLESELSRAECLLAEGGSNKTHCPTWASGFERDATNLGNQWSVETKKTFELEIDNLRVRAYSFAKAYRLRTVERSQKRLDDMERSLEVGAADSFWELPNAEQFIDQLDFAWDVELKKQHSEEYQRLKLRAVEIEERAAEAYHTRAISDALGSGIRSSMQVKSLLKRLQTAGLYFEKKGKLNEDLRARLRSALESLAWHRARKMLDDAEVAEAGGSIKKGSKLRAQAKVVLRQDWARVLGQKPLPNFDVMPEFTQASGESAGQTRSMLQTSPPTDVGGVSR